MSSAQRIKFIAPQRTDFHATVRARVEAFFKERGISPHANAAMVAKTVVLLALYLLPFILLMARQPGPGVAMGLWAIMGLGLAGIGMSVMHDANHGAYSSDERVNWWLGHTLNLLGGSAHNWKLQHNILHHTYTNITHVDDDIADRLVLKFSPHTGRRWYHRFQWLYATAFYGLLTLYWVAAKDLVQFRQYSNRGVLSGSQRAKRIALARIIALKAVYFLAAIGLPIALGLPWLQVLLGFLLMHFIAGAILTLVFQLAHTVEGTDHPLPDAHGVIADDWAAHQLRTTVDFSPGNRMLSWYVGGLNYQIEHHLFPRVSHVHYPAIAPIVKRTAQEFGLPYQVNATLLGALRSHFSLMRRIGLPDWNEAIG
jgi:linoleoyl-CoA desaturase